MPILSLWTNRTQILSKKPLQTTSYQSPGGEFEGGEGIRQYIEEVRTMSNSTHEISLRLHDEQASVAEGRVTGDTADGEPVQVRFADVFEFDEDDAKLTRCAVYLNDA